MLASHFKVLGSKFFYVLDKALSGELSYMQTGLAFCAGIFNFKICRVNGKHCGPYSGAIYFSI